MDIHKRLDELRIKRGWSRAELAREIGISYTALKNWYNEKNFMPSLKTIDDICAAFNITRSQFFSDVDCDNLRGDQLALLELYEKLPEGQRVNIIEIIRNLITQ